MPTIQTPAAIPAQKSARRRKLLLGAATAFALVAGAAGVTQNAWARPHHDDGWSMGQDVPVDRIEHRADRMLKRVDATADQQAKVHAIIEAAAKDIDPIRQGISGTQAKIRTLLTAPQIDRAAVETLRSQRMAGMDQISQRMTKAMGDAAEVLTPDQRQKLATIAADREARRAEHRKH